jgi:hypothetical protein
MSLPAVRVIVIFGTASLVFANVSPLVTWFLIFVLLGMPENASDEGTLRVVLAVVPLDSIILPGYFFSVLFFSLFYGVVKEVFDYDLGCANIMTGVAYNMNFEVLVLRGAEWAVRSTFYCQIT